jgi:YVTN family beta-propeller protein
VKSEYVRLAPAVLAASAIVIGLTAATQAMASPAAAHRTGPTPAVAYVVNEGGLQVPGTVTPINTKTGLAGPPIKVGGVPFKVAVTPNGETAYVADISRNVVTPISTATNKAGKPIKVGDGPFTLVITPNGKEVYTANDDSNTVTEISTATNKAAKPIPVGAYPVLIAVPANGNTVYSLGATQMSAISTTTNKARKPVFIGAGNHAFAISPDSKSVYVSNGNALVRFDAATLKITRQVRVGANWAVALSPNGKTLYTFTCSPNGKAGAITPVPTSTLRPGKPVQLGFCTAGETFSPDGKTLYIVKSPVGNVSGSVIPFRTASNTAGTPIIVGGQPGALALLPGATASAASTLYVVNTGSDSVTAINTATGKASATIGVGYLPTSIAIAR